MKDKLLINYPVGSRVIVRGNDITSQYMIGKIVDWKPFGDVKDQYIPFVRLEHNSKVYGVLGIIRHYSEELKKILDKLTPLEQWNVLCEFNIIKEEN